MYQASLQHLTLWIPLHPTNGHQQPCKIAPVAGRTQWQSGIRRTRPTRRRASQSRAPAQLTERRSGPTNNSAGRTGDHCYKFMCGFARSVHENSTTSVLDHLRIVPAKCGAIRLPLRFRMIVSTPDATARIWFAVPSMAINGNGLTLCVYSPVMAPFASDKTSHGYAPGSDRRSNASVSKTFHAAVDWPC